MKLKFNPHTHILSDAEDGQHIAELCDGATLEDGAFIETACNAHNTLVAALQNALYALNHLTDASDKSVEITNKVRAALEAADALPIPFPLP